MASTQAGDDGAPPDGAAGSVAARPARDVPAAGPGSTEANLPVHLLLCTNAPYVQHAAVCLASLLANNSELRFDIVLVGRVGEAMDEGRLRRSLSRFSNFSLEVRQFSPPRDVLLPLNPKAHYTLDNWTRLWVETFFPADVHRVLYLDSDIVVTGSIAPLWALDLEGALLGAVDIPGSPQGVLRLGLAAEAGYFNSGMLLIDLRQWRRTQALDTVLAYVAANPERLHDLDQDALNACFHHRRKRLGYEWNAIWPFFREPLALPLPRPEIEAVRQNARIIHFNGAAKPWNYLCNHPRKSEYTRYLAMTEWRGFVPADRTALNILRETIAPCLPAAARAALKRLLRRMFGLRFES